MNLARAIVTYGVWGLAAALPINAQQAASPVSTGSPGVATLRLDTYVAPVYPPIAQSARVSGEVVLDATIGSDGRPSDLRLLHSIPLFDQAAIDAVRQWRFEPPTVRGAPAPVRAPITIAFRQQGVSRSLPISPAVALHNPSLPRDFAIVVASNCPNDGQIGFDTVTGVFENTHGVVSVRVNLSVEPALLDQVYDVITRTGVMSDTTRLVQWPTVIEPEVSSDSGIRVLVFPGRPLFSSWSDGATPRQFLVDVRMNGTWTRLFPPASWRDLSPPDKVDARDGQLEKGALQIARLLERQVQSFEFVRTLPRDQQWCRWRD